MTTDMDLENTSDARKTAIIKMNFFVLMLILQLFRKHALLVKAQLKKIIIHSFGMISLLMNVGNMV